MMHNAVAPIPFVGLRHQDDDEDEIDGDNNNQGETTGGMRGPAPQAVDGRRLPLPERQHQNRRQQASQVQQVWKLSQIYCTVSAVLALLAIVTPSTSLTKSITGTNSSSPFPNTRVGGVFFDGNNNNNFPSATTASGSSASTISLSSQWSVEQVAKAAAVGLAAKRDNNKNSEGNNNKDEYSSKQSSASSTLTASSSSTVPTTPHELFLSLHDLLTGYLLDTPSSGDMQCTNGNGDNNQCVANPQMNGDGTKVADGGGMPGWLRWTALFHGSNNANKSTGSSSSTGTQAGRDGQEDTASLTSSVIKSLSTLSWSSWIDPTLRKPSSSTATDLIDKVLTSTPRLLAVANFLLAMTYVMHTAVAAWFLGSPVGTSMMGATGAAVGGFNGGIGPGTGIPPPGVTVADWGTSSGARERMGGFLVFKLLLISAVVAPDTLDLLILLTWYTLLSCLRSLDHLCQATTTHTSASGQTPRRGVLRLLLLVLGTDLVAAASCVALFHAAGWGMVLLLTCDCAILAVDLASHMLQHVSCVLEDTHTQQISALEARQLQLHGANNNNGVPTIVGTTTADRNNNAPSQLGARGVEPDESSETFHIVRDGREGHLAAEALTADGATTATGGSDNSSLQQHGDDPNQQHRLRQREEAQRSSVRHESRQLDRRMEVLELIHSRRLGILDTSMFVLQLVSHIFTVAHFLHIWSLHGVQFTLIDGVLALHLHSALSSACKKIAQRRNIHTIARDLNGLFPNASETELHKAAQAGDVCCICLGTMSTGHVKILKCGHLYHTHCLREVVERAQSIQAAKCPLCRASVVDGRQPTATSSSTPQAAAPQGNDSDNGEARPNAAAAARAIGPGAVGGEPGAGQLQQQGAGEYALFRFSTEEIFPAWVPLPAFSFEVVRRPPAAPPAQPQEQQRVVDSAAPANAAGTNAEGAENPNPPGDGPQQARHLAGGDFQLEQPAEQQQPQSFLRRFLVLAGAIPMSPEEEARALAQLVDMFPQYDRSDLLRELRERGSAEAVVEAVLIGVFSGVARG